MHLLPVSSSSDEVRRAANMGVLPVGSFEQHGDHLPLITDTAVACLVATRIAEAHGLFLLPPITMSCSHEHEGFAGTVSISASTLMVLIDDVRASLARTGIDKLVLVNGHGGNHVLANIVQQANVTGFRTMLFPTRDEWSTARDHAGLETNNHDDMHGGELETSIMLHALPELVGSSYRDADHEASHRPHFLVTGMRGYSEGGIIGRPSLATATKGKAVLESLTASFAEHYKVLMG